MTKKLLLVALGFFLSSAVFSEDIVTAAQLFGQISNHYAAINDYQAKISITQGHTSMSGSIFYKNPNRIRIDFDVPLGQVLNTDGKTLTIYLPSYQTSFTQELRKSSLGAAGLTTKNGLYIMANSYAIAYEYGPDPVAIDEGSSEKVTKLKLTSRAGGGYATMLVSVGSRGYIRRIVGIDKANNSVQFDFTDIHINQGLKDEKFNYSVPGTSNTVTNFLFEP